MSALVERILEFGIAGVALYMMYDIANNHLKEIAEILIRIEEKLDVR